MLLLCVYNNYAAIAEGYINIPEDGVYYLSSRMEQVWIDNKLVINNEGAVKAYTQLRQLCCIG